MDRFWIAPQLLPADQAMGAAGWSVSGVIAAFPLDAPGTQTDAQQHARVTVSLSCGVQSEDGVDTRFKAAPSIANRRWAGLKPAPKQ